MKKSKCPYCDNILTKNAVYCPICGEKLYDSRNFRPYLVREELEELEEFIKSEIKMNRFSSEISPIENKIKYYSPISALFKFNDDSFTLNINDVNYEFTYKEIFCIIQENEFLSIATRRDPHILLSPKSIVNPKLYNPQQMHEMFNIKKVVVERMIEIFKSKNVDVKSFERFSDIDKIYVKET